MSDKKEYSLERWCAAVAYLINCDNVAYEFSRDESGNLRVFTAEDIWNSNSHGELAGVYSAIELATAAHETGLNDFPSIIQGILDLPKGEEPKPNKDHHSDLGLIAMTRLYNMGEHFESQVYQIAKDHATNG